jgi:hypothetical protein
LKVRLYRGPFDGKVVNWRGGSTLVLNGTKRMTREQRMKEIHKYSFTTGQGFAYPDTMRVTAVYRQTPYIHPDGSVFYEWDKPRPKRRSRP